MFTILSKGYYQAGLNVSTQTGKYVAVNPDDYQGAWKGQFADKTAFTVSVSDVNGFRAKVKYQAGSNIQYQDVLIKNNAFRMGDAKFTLAANGAALVKEVVTSPVDGSSLIRQAHAQRS